MARKRERIVLVPSTLVERLRRCAEITLSNEEYNLLLEAAERIEELEKRTDEDVLYQMWIQSVKADNQ